MEPGELTATDREILAILGEGAGTPEFVAWRVDGESEAVRDRLEALADAGVVRPAGDVYELVSDPRDEE